MNFDQQITAPCIIPGAPVVDERCSDQDFALAHPVLCANQVVLILKPESALICRLGSISFRVFEYRTGVETEVLDNITFTSSDDDVFAIGVHSGSGTGLAEGVVTITATRNGLSATADVTVLAENTCCDDTNVATSILIDNSRSMSLQFGGSYGTRLVFAKAAATLYGNPILLANGLPKDKIKVWSFNDAPTQISSDFIQVDATVASQIAGVQQSLNKTDLLEALTSAVDDMLNATADEKILLLVSDGEETTITNRQTILDYGALFKAAGGIIIIVAPRASGAGYDLLERLATGGFFLNAISTNAADVLDELSYLKSILCVGRCVPAGDEYVPTPQLNFSSFSNWDVPTGQVNLIGNGLLDIQPGNGLYVDLNGGTAGTLRTIDTFALVSGRTYRIAFDVAGNNRLDSAGANQALKAYLRDVSANDSDPNIFDHTVSPAWDSPFATYSFTFVAPFDVTVRLYFEQLVNSGFSGTWHGNLLDNVVLDDVTSQITLMSDDFNQENLQYVPPNCGVGTTYIATDDCDYPRPTAAALSEGVGTVVSVSEDSTDAAMTIVATTNQILTGSPNDLNFIYVSYGATLLSAPNVVLVSGDPSVSTYDWQIISSSSTGFTINLHGSDTDIPLPVGTYTFVITTDAPSVPTENCYAYEVGYYCYTECNSGTPGTQSVDPSPLPDIESNYTPPITFTSTKTVCATCDEGFVNVSDTNLVPVMTSNTAPSGVASASDNNANAYKGFDGISTYSPLSAYQSVSTPAWLQYQFATAKIVSAYKLVCWKVAGSPRDFTFEGSNNGTTWTVLDSQSGISWFPGEEKRFLFTNTTAFLYYRLNVSDSPPDSEGGDSTVINELELYEAAVQSVCATATEISYVSQQDANAKASASALAAAQAQLNCVEQFTSTQSFTAQCPSNQYGLTQTVTISKTSLVSQAEADSSALTEATEQATAALDCTLSNNENAITLNDSTSGELAKATAYPSVKHVSGTVGLITNVTCSVSGLTHSSPDDLRFLLVSPSGTKVELMRNAGGTFAISNVNLVFSDAAGSALPDAALITSGTWQVSKFGVEAQYPSPAPVTPYGSLLSAFIGETANGSWNFFACDDTSLDSGSIASGFDLTITTA